ncbi:MAG: hypothetical protein B6U97_03710 [Candidatus Altiarchaeales archaeon ex4484_96]|nr:MAG: hypothetical protein B6U97_03710 [Candidatus Altiarchaeales archaeon ex4484_96]
MYKDNKIAVVVPAYNEKKLIRRVLDTIPFFVDWIIVVDDASTDDTGRVAEFSPDSRVTVIRHEVNRGVGGAIITGHKKALKLGADISVVMAGDAQMNPKFLPNLIDPLIEEAYDYTKGNRFLTNESVHEMPKTRVLGNIMLTFFTKLASGYWNIFDPQNGYTAIKANILKNLNHSQKLSPHSVVSFLWVNYFTHRVPLWDSFSPTALS